jgi:N-acetylmuramoyl-L-alanine amidase
MNFVTRSEWGARPPRATTRLSRVDTMVAHYTANNADERASHANCAVRVRGVQNYHMDHNGWNDIAYSFLVCKHGYVFEGRGYRNRTAATGADNNHTLAVSFLGDDTVGRDDVTDAGRTAFVQITQEIQRRWRKRMLYRGHRDFTATTCPGDELYRYIRSSRFAARVNPQRLPGPSPKPAWFWLWADWRLSGRQGPRPESAPRIIPLWAWRALSAWVERH